MMRFIEGKPLRAPPSGTFLNDVKTGQFIYHKTGQFYLLLTEYFDQYCAFFWLVCAGLAPCSRVVSPYKNYAGGAFFDKKKVLYVFNISLPGGFEYGRLFPFTV